MKFPAIRTDEYGETHFSVREIPDREVPFGPPPNPAGKMADFGAVTTMFVFSVSAGTDVPAHNAPQPCVHYPVGSGRGRHQRRRSTALRSRRCSFLRRPYREGACDTSHHRPGRGVRQPGYFIGKLTRWN